jgi:hypothetical protein
MPVVVNLGAVGFHADYIPIRLPLGFLYRPGSLPLRCAAPNALFLVLDSPLKARLDNLAAIAELQCRPLDPRQFSATFIERL